MGKGVLIDEHCVEVVVGLNEVRPVSTEHLGNGGGVTIRGSKGRWIFVAVGRGFAKDLFPIFFRLSLCQFEGYYGGIGVHLEGVFVAFFCLFVDGRKCVVYHVDDWNLGGALHVFEGGVGPMSFLLRALWGRTSAFGEVRARYASSTYIDKQVVVRSGYGFFVFVLFAPRWHPFFYLKGRGDRAL